MRLSKSFRHNYRLLIDNNSLWFKFGLYEIATFLLLGPLYRLLFWISVKTVKVKIIKTFNTEVYYGGRNSNGDYYNNTQECELPYKNNLEGFQINQFSEGGRVGVADFL